jgi:uncharacterized cupredoxin-like copper-binding protein
MVYRLIAAAACAALLLLAAAPAQAHDKHSHAAPKKYDAAQVVETPFGRQGDPAKARRTIAIGMSDDMRYTPAEITVKQGETVRLVISNKGKVLHELVLGTPEQLRKHAEVMRQHPDMDHGDDPSMVHVKPGKKGEVVWQFTQPGEFQYGCLLPGHFEAGMVGKVIVK